MVAVNHVPGCSRFQDLGTTQRYMHLSPAHKDAAIRLLDRRPTEEEPSGEAPAPSQLLAAKATNFGDGLETEMGFERNSRKDGQ